MLRMIGVAQLSIAADLARSESLLITSRDRVLALDSLYGVNHGARETCNPG